MHRACFPYRSVRIADALWPELAAIMHPRTSLAPVGCPPRCEPTRRSSDGLHPIIAAAHPLSTHVVLIATYWSILHSARIICYDLQLKYYTTTPSAAAREGEAENAAEDDLEAEGGSGGDAEGVLTARLLSLRMNLLASSRCVSSRAKHAAHI